MIIRIRTRNITDIVGTLEWFVDFEFFSQIRSGVGELGGSIFQKALEFHDFYIIVKEIMPSTTMLLDVGETFCMFKKLLILFENHHRLAYA